MSTAKAGLAQFVDAFGREETVRMLIEIFIEKADAEAGYSASEAKMWLRLGVYLTAAAAAADTNSRKAKKVVVPFLEGYNKDGQPVFGQKGIQQ